MKSGLVAIAIGLIALGLVSSLPRAGHAQSPPITAEVDRTRLSTDETLTLTVVIHGSGEIPSHSLPHLSDFDVVDQRESSWTSTRNQQTSTEVVYRYTLRPIRPGRATIGAFSVTVDGRTFATDPIEIEVSQGSARPMPRLDSSLRAPSPGFLAGQDYFVEAEVDNSNPYLGQQVVYFFRLYHAEPVSPRTSYVPPGLAGFWSRQEMEPMRFEANVANRRYRVLELRTVLFPTVAGSITIDPASVVIPAGLIRSSEELATEPVGLEVKPLPDGAPKDFDGAVGQFAIRAELDTIAGNVDEPVTLRVVLSGRGNIEALPEPQMAGYAKMARIRQQRDFQRRRHRQRLDGKPSLRACADSNDGRRLRHSASYLRIFRPREFHLSELSHRSYPDHDRPRRTAGARRQASGRRWSRVKGSWYSSHKASS